MKKMSTLLAICLIVAMLATLFAGCNRQPQPTVPSTVAPTDTTDPPKPTAPTEPTEPPEPTEPTEPPATEGGDLIEGTPGVGENPFD